MLVQKVAVRRAEGGRTHPVAFTEATFVMNTWLIVHGVAA